METGASIHEISRKLRLAIKTDGTLWAWGWNGRGQLGDGTTTDRHSPVQIGSDSNWEQVAAGGYHTLAIKTDGTLWAWGDDEYGQLGDGRGTWTMTERHSPVQIGSDSNWEQVAAGGYHTLAIKTDGTLWAWGNNEYNQLGDRENWWNPTHRHSPVQLYSVLKWEQVAAGQYHTLAIESDGPFWAWGRNYYGQLGDGTTTDRHDPVRIGSDSNWLQVAAGDRHTLAIKSDGTLWAWGDNGVGQLGDGTTTDKYSPVQIGSDSNWEQVAAGGYHTFAIKTDGTLWAWGWNREGRLGDGTTTDKYSPVFISNLLTSLAIPIPVSGQSFTYSATASPVLSADPSQAKPMGLGAVAEGGGTLGITVKTYQFSGPVDIYFGLYLPEIDPDNIYLLTSGGAFQKLSEGIAPWKANITGPVDESLFGDMQTSDLPIGTYYLYLLVTPTGNLSNYYLWITSFSSCNSLKFTPEGTTFFYDSIGRSLELGASEQITLLTTACGDSVTVSSVTKTLGGEWLSASSGGGSKVILNLDAGASGVQAGSTYTGTVKVVAGGITDNLYVTLQVQDSGTGDNQLPTPPPFPEFGGPSP